MLHLFGGRHEIITVEVLEMEIIFIFEMMSWKFTRDWIATC